MDILEKRKIEVDVSYEWHDRNKGIIQWNFENKSNAVVSGLLFRNSYPFGNAFWPIYNANSEVFGTYFSSVLVPLQNNGAENNTMPLAVYKNPDNSYFVAFVFTFGANEVWSCLEGGFSETMLPSGYKFIPAPKTGIGQYTITWAEGQCSGYNEQSGEHLPCPANPIQITASTMQLSSTVEPLFNDIIVPASQSPTCLDYIITGIETFNYGDIIKGLECTFGFLPEEQKEKIKKAFS